MSDFYPLDDLRREPDALMEKTEAIIRAARNFVRPSDYLRPRTLEAARVYCEDRRAEQKLGWIVIAALLLVVFSSPALQYAEVLRAQTSTSTATEIESRAIEYASQPEIGPHWGMAEAFTQLRRVQANRLGHSYGSMK